MISSHAMVSMTFVLGLDRHSDCLRSFILRANWSNAGG